MTNKFQAKRTSVSGRTPNTTNASNASFIDAGEFAVNLADKKLFTSNGTAYFEVGSNLTNLSVSSVATIGSISANGTLGNIGQILTSNGSAVYWATGSSGGGGSGNLTFGPTPPINPVTGDRWIDSNSGIEYNWFSDGNSSQWVELGPANAVQNGGISVSFGPTGPALPMTGDRWIDSNSGIEYTWINDGNSSQWVEMGVSNPTQTNAAAVSFGPTSPSLPKLGDRWIDSNSGIEYTWIVDTDTSQWVEMGVSNPTQTVGTGGGGSANGANGSVQFSSNGTFAASASFVFDATSNTLTIGTSTVNSTNFSGIANNSLYLGGVAPSAYQLNSTMAANVATLTANNTAFVGSVSSANVVSNTQLQANLANYQTISGLAAGVIALTSNNAQNLGGVAAGSYQLNSTMAANVATMTANNTTFVGTVAAANVVSNTQLQSNLANYQTVAGLATNVATLTSNSTNYVGSLSAGNVPSKTQMQANLANYLQVANVASSVAAATANDSLYLGGTPAASYQLNSSLAANVATLTANNTTFVGTVAAANVVSNTQLQANLASYQTSAGLSSNVATLTANNTAFVGSVSSANVVSNTQLQANLASYQTVAGLAVGVLTLSSNNSSFLGGTSAASYQLSSTLAANVATMTANNTAFVGSTTAANVVSNTQLQSNLSNYQTVAGLAANVATMTANNTTNFGGLAVSYFTDASNMSTGILPYARIPGNIANTTANFTFSGVHTHTSNIVVATTASIVANGTNGTPGQVLTSNGTTAYWSTAGTGGTSITPVLVDVDFGNAHATSKTIMVSDAAATTTSKVFASVPLTQPTGVQFDELELDPINVHGSVLSNGTITFMVVSTTGSAISGHRYIQYFLT